MAWRWKQRLAAAAEYLASIHGKRHRIIAQNGVKSAAYGGSGGISVIGGVMAAAAAKSEWHRIAQHHISIAHINNEKRMARAARRIEAPAWQHQKRSKARVTA